MKIQILDRYILEDDWHEIYANGELIFEGEVHAVKLLDVFLKWLGDKEDVEVEVRFYEPEYEYDGTGEYEPPLHSINGKDYWSDWEKANVIDS
jgi:hypothetical protein